MARWAGAVSTRPMRSCIGIIDAMRTVYADGRGRHVDRAFTRPVHTTGVGQAQGTLQIEQLVTFTMEQETYQVAYGDEHTRLIFGCYDTVTSERGNRPTHTYPATGILLYRLIGDHLHVVHMHLKPTLGEVVD